jgi:YacP-like NYN domain
VVRSRWPNLDERRFVSLARRWAAREDAELVLVFDGAAPAAGGEQPPDDPTRVVGTGPRSADDWIAEEASRLASARRRLWLVTSDRGLRARVEAEGTIGGGAFAGELERLDESAGQAG